MGKCYVCGKSISDFSEKCPYCGYVKGDPIDVNTSKAKERLSKKSVLISFVLNVIFLAVFRIFRLPEYYYFSGYNIIKTVSYMICSIYAIIVIHKHGIIAHSHGKAFCGVAIVSSILMLLLLHVYGVYMGYEISLRYVFFGAANAIFFIIQKIISATLLTTTLIEIRFLLSKNKIVG